MDGDVNDPLAPRTDNNAFDQAQSMATPAMVGGYVTFKQTDKAGDAFADEADPFDYYQVTLAAGQSIVLSISDWPGTDAQPVDLDLYLLDGLNNTVKTSLGAHATESITVDVDGDYVIAVHAEQGASNYVMTVGQSQVASVGE
jgi:hypothetical protein